ncbi:MAG: hypothetical protein OSB10_08680 [Planctomycetota bacterium]|nr:hypothetical protein [Planctomycetota bacterium]
MFALLHLALALGALADPALADPTEPAIQRPDTSFTPDSPAPTPAPGPAPPASTSSSDSGYATAPTEWSQDGSFEQDKKDAQEEPEPEGKKRSERFGGRKLFRLAISPHFGWTNGVSQKNGLFDLQATIDSSIENMQGTIAGAGNLGAQRFGGFAYGFDIDLEIFFLNIAADFDKFLNPGGMWTLRLGYDHDFRPHERININLGLSGGFMRIFLGDALEQLDFDPSDPTKTDIARAGFVTRLNLNFDIWLAGPLYTGPQFMVGYHYLFSANDKSVIAEKGLHYALAWNLKLRFALPTENPRK